MCSVTPNEFGPSSTTVALLTSLAKSPAKGVARCIEMRLSHLKSDWLNTHTHSTCNGRNLPDHITLVAPLYFNGVLGLCRVREKVPNELGTSFFRHSNNPLCVGSDIKRLSAIWTSLYQFVARRRLGCLFFGRRVGIHDGRSYLSGVP